MRDLASAESIALEYARHSGIKADSDDALDALRAISAEELKRGTEAYALAIFGGPEVPGLSHSIIDGRLVVEAPEAALRNGRAAPVSVLVGANDYDLAVSPAQTKEALFARFGPLSSQAQRLYDPKGTLPLKDLVQAVAADYAMVEPSRNIAELVTRHGQPAYFYRFSYVPESLRKKVPGTLHAAEILFAFDYAGPFLKEAATPADAAMAKSTSGYWVDFVKSGNPNGGGRIEWPRYDPNEENVLNFTNAGIVFGPDPIKERLDLCKQVWGHSF
jgi:para-nitrobenzyl esterase